MPPAHRHLPYQINEQSCRSDYYETLWKHVGLKLVLDHTNPGNSPRLLDYGCGRGEMLKIAADAGFQTQGCDPDPMCVELSAKHGNVELLDLKNPHALYHENAFDVVTCLHVLEHVPHPSELLDYFQRICSGYLLVAIPNLRTLMYFRHRPQPDNLRVNEGHLHGWDHDTFLNLMIRHHSFKFCGWAHDTTILPLLSPVIQKLAGTKNCIKIETGVFKRILPFHCHSIIGLFRVVQ